MYKLSLKKNKYEKTTLIPDSLIGDIEFTARDLLYRFSLWDKRRKKLENKKRRMA